MEMEALGNFIESSRTRSATNMPKSAGAEAASFGEAPENFYSFFFFYAGVQDSECNSVETGTKVVP